MMAKQLYIIRHGQTDLNHQGIVQGRGIDSPLNEMGLRQADAFFQAYKNIPFDKIYVSQLQRTLQTVAQFVDLGISYTQLTGLDEIGWGHYEGMRQTPEILEGFQKLISDWNQGNLDVHVEGGESPNQLIARQKEAIQHILNQQDEQNILICMHGRAMRILLSWLSGAEVSQMDQFKHTNTALYKLSFNGNNFEIVDAYNVQHLKSLNLLHEH